MSWFSRVLEPGSKPAMARALAAETRHTTLAEVLGLEGVHEDALMGPWTGRRCRGKRQSSRPWWNGICRKARWCSTTCPRPILKATVVLWRVGHWRDERKGKPQIVLGVLSNGEGCPVAVEVFTVNRLGLSANPGRCLVSGSQPTGSRARIAAYAARLPLAGREDAAALGRLGLAHDRTELSQGYALPGSLDAEDSPE